MRQGTGEVLWNFNRNSVARNSLITLSRKNIAAWNTSSVETWSLINVVAGKIINVVAWKITDMWHGTYALFVHETGAMLLYLWQGTRAISLN